MDDGGPTNLVVKAEVGASDATISRHVFLPRLWFEAAPPIMAGDRATVSGALYRLLTGEGAVALAASQDRALLLGAIWYRLATGVLEDLGLPPVLPSSPRWRRGPELATRHEVVGAMEFTWIGLDPLDVRPLPQLQALLWALPGRLVNAVLGWAPPVILPPDRDGRRVVANHFAAILARQRRPGAELCAYPLVQPRAWPRRSLPELCQGLVRILWPLYRDHERRLVELAQDETEAAWLTGCARAQYFRIRRRREGGGSR